MLSQAMYTKEKLEDQLGEARFMLDIVKTTMYNPSIAPRLIQTVIPRLEIAYGVCDRRVGLALLNEQLLHDTDQCLVDLLEWLHIEIHGPPPEEGSPGPYLTPGPHVTPGL